MVHHDVDADGREMVLHPGTGSLDRDPGVLVRLPDRPPLHQLDDRPGDRAFVAHARLTVTFGSLARLVSCGSVGSAYSSTLSSDSSISTVTSPVSRAR